MLEYAIKVAVTSILVVAVSEAAKRSTLLGAALASLPITSLLAMIWLWADTKDPERVAALANGIFWLILPSLVLLLTFPLLLRQGVPFAPSLLIAVALTIASYLAMIAALKRLGIDI